MGNSFLPILNIQDKNSIVRVRDSKGGEERAGAECNEAPKRSEALHSPTDCLGVCQGDRARPKINI